MKKLALAFGTILFLSTGSSAHTNNHKVIIENPQEGKVFHVDVEQFNKLVTSDKGTVLDVRTPGEWAEGTIAGAVKIDYYGDDFAKQIQKLDKSKPVFVYCKAGGRSSSAADILKENGFSKVFNLTGGITAWKKAGKKISK
jgi:rhodanese-related sulfurtransferase